MMCLKLQVMHVLICLFEIKFRFSRYNDSLNVSLYHIKGIFLLHFFVKRGGEWNWTGLWWRKWCSRFQEVFYLKKIELWATLNLMNIVFAWVFKLFRSHARVHTWGGIREIAPSPINYSFMGGEVILVT